MEIKGDFEDLRANKRKLKQIGIKPILVSHFGEQKREREEKRERKRIEGEEEEKKRGRKKVWILVWFCFGFCMEIICVWN